MLIYRAVCKEEYVKTLKAKAPVFDIKRFKWFSHNLWFIRNRVLDGKFNNSKYRPNRYQYILAFEWDGFKADFISTYEIQFDRRRNPNIKFKFVQSFIDDQSIKRR